MTPLRRIVALQPHGRNLLSPKAEMWLLLLRVNILLILAAEGLAWSYIGWLMGAQTSPWAGALLLGGGIVILVGSIDAAFAMLDLSELRRGNGSDDEHGLRANITALFRKYGNRARIGVAFRIAMVVASLLITSPFLAQLMFSVDINNLRESDYRAAIARKHNEIAAGFDRAITTARANRSEKAEQYSREIAGRGDSGRFGVGPVARSLGAEIVALDRRITELEQQKALRLAALKQATPAQRAEEFGVALAADGIAARFTALDRFEQIPGFVRAENAIRAVLFGLFIALLLLKWYEPRALGMYLDEELQDAFDRYRAGAYADWHDRGNLRPDAMTPFEFHRWYYGSVKRRVKTEEERSRLAEISARQADLDAAVQRLSDRPGEDMKILIDARTAKAREFDSASERLKSLEAEAGAVDDEIALCEAELRNAAQTIAAEARFSASAVLLKKQENWEKRRNDAQARRRLQSERLQSARDVRDRLAADLRQIDELISAQNALMAEIAGAAVRARRAALVDLGGAG